MPLALVWLSRPIARIGCCGPPQPLYSTLRYDCLPWSNGVSSGSRETEFRLRRPAPNFTPGAGLEARDDDFGAVDDALGGIKEFLTPMVGRVPPFVRSNNVALSFCSRSRRRRLSVD